MSVLSTSALANSFSLQSAALTLKTWSARNYFCHMSLCCSVDLTDKKKKKPLSTVQPQRRAKTPWYGFRLKGYQADLSVSARRQSSHLGPFCTASARPAPRRASLREGVGPAEFHPGLLAGRWQGKAAGWILLAPAVTSATLAPARPDQTAGVLTQAVAAGKCRKRRFL